MNQKVVLFFTLCLAVLSNPSLMASPAPSQNLLAPPSETSVLNIPASVLTDAKLIEESITKVALSLNIEFYGGGSKAWISDFYQQMKNVGISNKTGLIMADGNVYFLIEGKEGKVFFGKIQNNADSGMDRRLSSFLELNHPIVSEAKTQLFEIKKNSRSFARLSLITDIFVPLTDSIPFDLDFYDLDMVTSPANVFYKGTEVWAQNLGYYHLLAPIKWVLQRLIDFLHPRLTQLGPNPVFPIYSQPQPSGLDDECSMWTERLCGRNFAIKSGDSIVEFRKFLSDMQSALKGDLRNHSMFWTNQNNSVNGSPEQSVSRLDLFSDPLFEYLAQQGLQGQMDGLKKLRSHIRLMVAAHHAMTRIQNNPDPGINSDYIGYNLDFYHFTPEVKSKIFELLIEGLRDYRGRLNLFSSMDAHILIQLARKNIPFMQDQPYPPADLYGFWHALQLST